MAIKLVWENNTTNIHSCSSTDFDNGIWTSPNMINSYDLTIPVNSGFRGRLSRLYHRPCVKNLLFFLALAHASSHDGRSRAKNLFFIFYFEGLYLILILDNVLWLLFCSRWLQGLLQVSLTQCFLISDSCSVIFRDLALYLLTLKCLLRRWGKEVISTFILRFFPG